MNLFLLPVHSSVSLLALCHIITISVFFYQVAIRLEVCVLLFYCSQCRQKMKMNLYLNAF